MDNGGCFEKVLAGELFEVKSNPQLNKDSFVFSDKGEYPYFTRTVLNNGIAGYVEYLNEENKIKGNCLTVGMLGMQFFYMEKDFYSGQFTKTLYPKEDKLPLFNCWVAQYFITILNKFQTVYQGGLVRDFEDTFNKSEFFLPFKNNKVDLNYIQEFITELQAERLQELQGYLKVTGLSNYTLTEEEQRAIDDLDNVEWGIFNIEKLFGKATRGKRLKSADRISGGLPFVTAGENDTGISAFIGNDVEVFKANTITIDMFGSAKYRNYQYGADDHIAVVHCDKLAKEAVCFLTSAIHKVSNAGQFSYAKNFYAKDADELNISLPTKNNVPDYALMKTLGSAVKKLVIADVVKYADRELSAYQSVIGE
ncbi:phosphoribosylglycinamide formyltransferase [Haemophilus quentini]|nr:restriction endonuclease subunit S [Haemophilus quentini]NYA48086.1 restriction endonuclease subunit S [Haemophilus haemolyticus]ORC35274.1 phosphoribosylglycinamide formyltransferase [Haemophilus quentini]